MPAARDWEWIQFNSSSDPASSITYAEVRYGGSNAGDPEARRALDPAGECGASLDRITFTDNYRNGAEVVEGTWTTNTLNSTTVVYWLRNNVEVQGGHTLTILPGVKLAAGAGAGLYVTSNAKLIANGTQNAPIIFTSERDDTVCGLGVTGQAICDTNNDGGATVPSSRDWEWIQFNSGSDPASSITYAEVRYGGSNAGDPAARRAPIRLVNVVPALDRITFTDNYRNGAEVVEGTWTTNTLISTTVVYWLRNNVEVQGGNTLTILPGVKLAAGAGAGLYVTSNAKLIANGTQNAPIIFTSERDDTVCGVGVAGQAICDTNNDGGATMPAARDWEWIQFNSSSDPASSITYAEVRYGGSNAGDPSG